jgi:hypothetical protein
MGWKILREKGVLPTAPMPSGICVPQPADGMVDGTIQVSQKRILIEHERIMNEFTDGSEDSYTHTNECVDFSCSPGVSTLTSTVRTYLVLICFFCYFGLCSVNGHHRVM